MLFVFVCVVLCFAFSRLFYLYLSCSFLFVFFFKQKTAYEMRISDWSSDVCSSDLLLDQARGYFGHDSVLSFIFVGPARQAAARTAPGKIGRASCRERVCQYV